MRSELVLAINQLCAERKLSPEVVMEAVEASLISAYKRNFGATTNIEVRIDSDTSDVRVFAAKEVVDDVQDRKAQISLEEARQIDPEIQLDLARGLPDDGISGLVNARDVLSTVSGVAFIELTRGDIVRHPLVQDIVEAYGEEAARLNGAAGEAGSEGAE